ncbi:MAG: ribosome biogenesis GTP-binding protein YihA/YsxC [Syntrophothermus sp.]
MKISSAKFICSSPDLKRCPLSDIPEFAFIGRSNVGKSSLINMIAGFRGLAKVSSTPGKTRLINFFLINDQWHLVDLPGYGFAKLSKEEKSKFEGTIKSYLERRNNLKLIFLLIDSRHESQKADLEFMSWLIKHQLPFIILFTKTDKLNRNQLQASRMKYLSSLTREFGIDGTIILTSAEKKSGKEEVLGIIEEIISGNFTSD